MGSTHPAIPTTYHGVRFRSRLEARWAAFFDVVGWPWSYEPIDLAGYTPDFILRFPHGAMLAEVKPALGMADLFGFTEKIDASGWNGEALLLGCEPVPLGSQWGLGCLIKESADLDCFGASRFPWNEGFFFHCLSCDRTSVASELGWWGCRVTGCSPARNSNSHLGVGPDNIEATRDAWARASNAVQWRRGES